MKVSLDTMLTSTLVACALATTGVVIYQNFGTPPPASASLADQKPMFIEDWREFLETGVRVGSPNARVQLIEFADFECPICASFEVTLKVIRRRYPAHVALSFVHYPLPGHRYAEPAARVVECADEQGRFEAMRDLLFEQQNKFGLKGWSEFAMDAEVSDVAAFKSCIENNEPMHRIESGKRLAQQLNVPGTPTLIINGWRLTRPPREDELDRMVRLILAGRDPVAPY